MDKHLFHADLLGDLWRFFPSSCTIQEAVVTLNSFGEELLVFTDKLGHIDLPCAMATTPGGERRMAEMTPDIHGFHVTIAGYYPDIVPKMRAVVDGVTLDIRYAEVDSHARLTRLMCEVIA